MWLRRVMGLSVNCVWSRQAASVDGMSVGEIRDHRVTRMKQRKSDVSDLRNRYWQNSETPEFCGMQESRIALRSVPATLAPTRLPSPIARRLATWYDRHALRVPAFLPLAATMLWMR